MKESYCSISRSDIVKGMTLVTNILSLGTMIGEGVYLLKNDEISEKQYNHLRNVFYPALSLFIFTGASLCIQPPKFSDWCHSLFSKCKKETTNPEALLEEENNTNNTYQVV